MKKYENGKYVEMTDEEVEAFGKAQSAGMPSLEERLQSLETAYSSLCTRLQTLFSI